MQTEYKHIKFIKADSVGGWICLNRISAGDLGTVFYYGPWRKFVYEPAELGHCVFDSGCLRNIAHFLDQLNEEKKTPAVSGANNQ